MNTKGDDVYLGVWIAKEGAMITFLCRKDFLHVPSSAPMNGPALFLLLQCRSSLVGMWDIETRS